MTMFKGTTPTHAFQVPIDSSMIKEVKITYSQRDEEVLVKRTKDCIIAGGVYRFFDMVSKSFFDSMTDTPLEGGNL